MKIWFADFWPEWKDEDFITPILKKHHDVRMDQRDPDVVFHSIFGGMRETPRYRCKKVLILGENHRPGRFGSDYSISFDPHSETNFRLPLWQMFVLRDPSLWDALVQRKRWHEFDRFCSFSVSNPSNVIRMSHFDQLSQYKRVHSYGKVRMNDMGLKRASEGVYWHNAKLAFFNEVKHKFSMTYENSSYPYYCTEKLMDAFLVGSLPIYWGDPRVHEDWNEKAFINIMRTPDWYNKIVNLDKNDELFGEIYEQPIFTDDQRERHLENMAEFERWLFKITE